ncbi:MAG: hypothetical protein RMK50_04655 [Nitrososphaerota archaeon]|nr:hypothetical protein [Candidatus Bathyarchaeota archaeon]MDW8194090.1 hypothetical protein [Nitrososphaerota archaeon]
MASKSAAEGSRRIKGLIFLVIAALVISIGYSIYRQASRSMEAKAIEAGLIESGDTPTIYFNLKNAGVATVNYTYLVKLNATETLDSGLIVNIPPGQIFHYTLVLSRPEEGAVSVKLEIYLGEKANFSPMYSQTWIIKAVKDK